MWLKAGKADDQVSEQQFSFCAAGPSTSRDAGAEKKEEEPDPGPQLPRLSEQLNLDELWSTLGDCLKELTLTPDHHAVLILQPAVEAFFIVHAGECILSSGWRGGGGATLFMLHVCVWWWEYIIVHAMSYEFVCSVTQERRSQSIILKFYAVLHRREGVEA